MPKPQAVKIIEAAANLAEEARAFRFAERGSEPPGAGQREIRIRAVLRRLTAAMDRVRSINGQLQWNAALLSPAEEALLRETSRAIQYERRQLKKMQRKDPAG